MEFDDILEPMTVKQWIISGLTAVFLVATTVLVTLYASGYRVDLEDRSLRGTGIISVSSIPDGALVYLNDVPKDATNTSISGLKPGEYSLRLEKQGFANWEKKVEVKKELVTTEKALLIPLVPEFKPLTITGVQNPHISPDKQRILYQVTSGGDAAGSEKGIWMLDIAERPFDLTNRPSALLPDDSKRSYSQAQLEWGPDSKTFLVTLEEATFQYDLTTNQLEEVTDLEKLRKEWSLQRQETQEKLFENLDKEAVDKIKALPEPIWSPDNSRVLYSLQEGEGTIYRVYDLKPNVVERIDKPQPREYTTLTVGEGEFVKVGWFSDSQHLILLRKDSTESSTGTVSVVEIEGSNKTEVFTGTVVGEEVVATPNGSKLVVLTNFNPASQENNLYTISLR